MLLKRNLTFQKLSSNVQKNLQLYRHHHYNESHLASWLTAAIFFCSFWFCRLLSCIQNDHNLDKISGTFKGNSQIIGLLIGISNHSK